MLRKAQTGRQFQLVSRFHSLPKIKVKQQHKAKRTQES